MSEFGKNKLNIFQEIKCVSEFGENNVNIIQEIECVSEVGEKISELDLSKYQLDMWKSQLDIWKLFWVMFVENLEFSLDAHLL